MRSKFSLIFILLIISSIVAKRVEYECRSLQVKSLSCQLPSTHHLNSRNPIIWFKNFNQSSFNEMTTVEFYKYEVSSYMPSRIGQTFPKITYLMFRRSSVQYVMRRNL
ncbi:hypothetical protein PVAND_003251 [Polypedilum vanderplanki]|uniref:Secreted protein n=1 Tax=Polypedilum vanderplanki TaxID=319348 RepID=A0A9J6BU03_POLVA|nr:hypothetical protein PVAND_003251 [Polypedilum vanderplanki]